MHPASLDFFSNVATRRVNAVVKQIEQRFCLRPRGEVLPAFRFRPGTTDNHKRRIGVGHILSTLEFGVASYGVDERLEFLVGKADDGTDGQIVVAVVVGAYAQMA